MPLPIPDYLRCIHQREELSQIDGGCSVGQVPVLACALFGRCLLRKCNSLQGEEAQLPNCQGCEQQQRPDGRAALATLRRAAAAGFLGESEPGASPPDPFAARASRKAARQREVRESGAMLAKRRFSRWQTGGYIPRLLQRTELDPAILGGEHPTIKFQPSLCRFQNRWLMAYRGSWDYAAVWLAELDPEAGWKPLWSRRLPLPPLPGVIAWEDPRLFVAQKRLFVSYNSYTGSVAKVHISEITQHGEHLRRLSPVVSGPLIWEKNWACFEFAGQLACVYDPEVHHVLQLDDGGQVASDHRSPWNTAAWEWGRLRGGAPPVRQQDEYYHFFHGTLDGPPRTYSLGVYTFAAEPPFSPRRLATWPLLVPDPEDHRGVTEPHVVFPCGAVKSGGRWIVSVGWFDTACQILEYDAETIEQALSPRHRQPPPHFQVRGPIDQIIVDEVIARNEYRLPNRFAPSDVILDLGGNIGSFTTACLERGAGLVLAVEPIAANARLFVENASPYPGRWELVTGAVLTRAERQLAVEQWIRSDGTHVMKGVYQYDPSPHDAGWTTSRLEQPIKAELQISTTITMSELLAAAQRSAAAAGIAADNRPIRLVKIDCEGPEWGLILEDGADWLQQVQEICGEYHLVYAGHWTLDQLLAALQAAGFQTETVPVEHDRGLFFAWRVEPVDGVPDSADSGR